MIPTLHFIVVEINKSAFLRSEFFFIAAAKFTVSITFFFHCYRELYATISLLITTGFTREVVSTRRLICFNTYTYTRYTQTFKIQRHNESSRTASGQLSSAYCHYIIAKTLNLACYAHTPERYLTKLGLCRLL